MKRSTRAQWISRVRRLREGGNDAKTFAAREGLNERTLQWWAWRLEREGAVEPAPRAACTPMGASSKTSFIELRPITTEIAAAKHVESDLLELVLSSGRIVRVPANFDAASLVRLVTALDGGMR